MHPDAHCSGSNRDDLQPQMKMRLWHMKMQAVADEGEGGWQIKMKAVADEDDDGGR